VAIDVDETYRRFGPMVLRRCRRLLRHDEKARDAMQDTFVQLLRHQDRLAAEATSSLLYRIATNVCLNRLRGERRRPEDPEDDLIQRIADTKEEPGFGASMARLFLGQAFEGELESTRTIAVLHLVDGMTLEEVADEVGMSVSGIRKRLRGLKARVRELEEVAS
jgi:RNA polymerase sigma-70 factor (ECF subfamily)